MKLTNNINENEILFYEEQKPARKWLICVILFYSVFITYLTYEQVFLKKMVFDLPFSNKIWLLLWFFFALVLPVLFFLSKMKTEVRQNGIYIKYFPFYLNFVKISPEDIQSFESVIYNPLKDYGGWGLRYGVKGNAISAYGNKGINIKITYARDMLIGTQKPDELFNAIEKLKANYIEPQSKQ
ncbi:MAG: DUF6141 family protein [Candidatus Gastranaerophilaceae bacterium]|jgi:hypothetical protein